MQIYIKIKINFDAKIEIKRANVKSPKIIGAYSFLKGYFIIARKTIIKSFGNGVRPM